MSKLNILKLPCLSAVAAVAAVATEDTHMPPPSIEVGFRLGPAKTPIFPGPPPPKDILQTPNLRVIPPLPRWSRMSVAGGEGGGIKFGFFLFFNDETKNKIGYIFHIHTVNISSHSFGVQNPY